MHHFHHGLLERFGPGYNSSFNNDPGGLLENVCDGSDTGRGTASDVLLFLWDFYNADSGIYCTGGEQPTFWDIMRVYAKGRLNGGLDKDNYATKMEAGAHSVGMASCLANSGSSDEYNYYQEHNGANH